MARGQSSDDHLETRVESRYGGCYRSTYLNATMQCNHQRLASTACGVEHFFLSAAAFQSFQQSQVVVETCLICETMLHSSRFAVKTTAVVHLNLGCREPCRVD